MAKVWKLPQQHPLNYASFPRLSGGLNLFPAEERLSANESPEMENLWWEDGVLQSRPGQLPVPVSADNGVSNPGPCFAVTASPFHGSLFLHLGSRLYRWDGQMDGDSAVLRSLELGDAARNVPMNRGTFFTFGDFLYYKNRGAFLRIAYDSRARTFSVSSVAAEPYTPTILMNADPLTAAGDLYQPENRLSPLKRVLYSASTFSQKTEPRTASGTARLFPLGRTAADGLHAVSSVYVGGVETDPALYDVNLRTGFLTFADPPEAGKSVVAQLEINNPHYVLPVQNVAEITEITVDGRELSEGTDYAVNLVYGTVDFVKAPAVSDPPVNNTVSITYRKENRDAYNAVMNCTCAAVYGSGTQLCIVAGGCAAQPNAVFWSGSTDVGLDPSYWPVPFYNLVGDTEDCVTGFGRQYGDLMVFKARSIGKLDASIVDLGGRDSLSLTYTTVNDHIGCDLPRTIRNIGNNLVFANTEAGVFRIRSASPAYENNVECISDKVLGSEQRPGLLRDLRTEDASAHDDGRRYFLAVNSHVWLWDYAISSFDNPTWFYFTGFPDTAAWFQFDGTMYLCREAGRLFRLGRVFSDDGKPFRRLYRFPVQFFGSYDRLKDVLTVIVALRGEEASTTRLTYLTDYEQREDLTPLSTSGSQSVSPRNLTFRDLSVNNHAAVFRRRPMCRHVRHFSMRLENNNAGEDLAILYAQMQVRFLGRDR